MLGSDIITFLRSMLDEPSARAKYYLDAELLMWFNLAYVDFVKRTDCIYDQTNITVTGGYDNDVDTTADSPTHTMPVNFAHVNPHHGVWWNAPAGTPYELERTTQVQQSSEGAQPAMNSAGSPRWYSVEGRRYSSDNIYLNVWPYPADAGNLLYCYYTPIVTDITSLDAPLLDDDDIEVVCARAVMFGKRKRQLFDEGREWERVYLDGVSARISDMANEIKGEMRTTKPWLNYNE